MTTISFDGKSGQPAKTFPYWLLTSLILVFLLSFTPVAQAQSVGLYFPGIAGGIKSADPPPFPGVYHNTGYLTYFAKGVRDSQGNQLLPNLNIGLNGLLQTFVWVSPFKVLGARYGTTFFLYFLNPNLDFDQVLLVGRNSNFGLGDVYFEPINLGWSGRRYGAVFSYGFYAPTGSFNPLSRGNIGRGTWTHQFNVGGTVYFDKARTWSLTNWVRGEFHHKTRDVDMTLGSFIYWEWALAKTFVQILDVGAVGYGAWQVTDTTGADAPFFGNRHGRVYGVGGELGISMPKAKARFSMRGYGEFGSRLRTQGGVIFLNFAIALWNPKLPPGVKPPSTPGGPPADY